MCVLWSDQENNKCLVTHECLKKKAKEVLFSESHRCFFCSIVVVESWLLHLLHNVITVWLLHVAFPTLKHGRRKPEDDDKHIQECNLTLLFIILTLLVILILQKSWETLHFFVLNLPSKINLLCTKHKFPGWQQHGINCLADGTWKPKPCQKHSKKVLICLCNLKWRIGRRRRIWTFLIVLQP